ncbi:MAG: hypothetical protein R3C30_06375 [Hyphomonadaceae bacterium]
MEKSRIESATTSRRMGAKPRKRSAVKATRSATLVSAARRNADPRSFAKIAKAIAYETMTATIVTATMRPVRVLKGFTLFRRAP